ncbi:unnamed protein product [Caenorhabditis angaria]|uniref:Uncharacterized protein n=1 Tax=Caenorhabditis angaria TaxID=860376 RepID=A0A9P1N905_9PELO|nr:unnamed protein product [Caenorhabditis angaria]
MIVLLHVIFGTFGGGSKEEMNVKDFYDSQYPAFFLECYVSDSLMILKVRVNSKLLTMLTIFDDDDDVIQHLNTRPKDN